MDLIEETCYFCGKKFSLKKTNKEKAIHSIMVETQAEEMRDFFGSEVTHLERVRCCKECLKAFDEIPQNKGTV